MNKRQRSQQRVGDLLVVIEGHRRDRFARSHEKYERDAGQPDEDRRAKQYGDPEHGEHVTAKWREVGLTDRIGGGERSGHSEAGHAQERFSGRIATRFARSALQIRAAGTDCSAIRGMPKASRLDDWASVATKRQEASVSKAHTDAATIPLNASDKLRALSGRNCWENPIESSRP